MEATLLFFPFLLTTWSNTTSGFLGKISLSRGGKICAAQRSSPQAGPTLLHQDDTRSWRALRTVNESFSFLVRPETIRELIEAASGSSRSPHDSTRSMSRLMKEAVSLGRMREMLSSTMLARGRESRREERLMMRSTGMDLEVGKPRVSRDPEIEVNS